MIAFCSLLREFWRTAGAHDGFERLKMSWASDRSGYLANCGSAMAADSSVGLIKRDEGAYEIMIVSFGEVGMNEKWDRAVMQGVVVSLELG